MITLLRRRSHLEPLAITTSPAPVLGEGHVDVCAGDAAPVASPARTFEPVETEVDLERQVGPVPPAYEPGRCYHQDHAVLNGLRYGVSPMDSSAVLNRAALTLCHHRNKDGF